MAFVSPPPPPPIMVPPSILAAPLFGKKSQEEKVEEPIAKKPVEKKVFVGTPIMRSAPGAEPMSSSMVLGMLLLIVLLGFAFSKLFSEKEPK